MNPHHFCWFGSHVLPEVSARLDRWQKPHSSRNKWGSIGLSKNTFDVIVPFKVVDHVDCFNRCHALLRDWRKNAHHNSSSPNRLDPQNNRILWARSVMHKPTPSPDLLKDGMHFTIQANQHFSRSRPVGLPSERPLFRVLSDNLKFPCESA